jgi:hypothetical protein
MASGSLVRPLPRDLPSSSSAASAFDLTRVDPIHRAELDALAQLYVDAGMRPLMLTMKVRRSKQPHLWLASVRDHRGPGRLEPIE